LPPIDLDAPPADLDATGVTILVPVDRPRYQRFRATLDGANLAVTSNAATASSGSAFDLVSNIVARRKAAEASARDMSARAAAEAEKLRVQAWQAALSEAASILPRGPDGTALVWYTRRRSIAQQPRVTGTGVALSGDDVSLNALVNANLDRLKLAKRLATINGDATPQATVRLMSLLASPGVANSDIMTVSVVSDIEKVIKADLPALPEPVQPIDRTIAAAAATPADRIELIRRARELGGSGLADLLAARDGLARVAAASAAGTTTAARDDTQLKLGEGEGMDVAQDYSDPRLGEVLRRAASAIRGDWPSAKDAVWLGESGKSLAVDVAFRAVGEEKLGDFADLLKAAVTAQDVNAIDELLAKMA
jgi:hypothetical protein